MTARIPPQPDGLNRFGNGRGVGKVTKPRAKKMGADKDRTLPVVQARTGLDTSSYEGAEQIDPNKPLTEKQRLFVKYWAQGETIRTASERAGYNDGATYAYRMVRMPNVLKLYNEEKAKYEEAAQMTRKKVMDGLLEGIEMAKMMAEPATVITGWKTIGQMCGYFAPIEKKVKLTVEGEIAVRKLETMSDEELMKLISGPAEALIHQEADDDDDSQA